MDVVKANQFYSSSLRVFYNSILSQQQQQFQLDSKLIAFYTILTVALSVLLLSIKQSRQLLLISTLQVSYGAPYRYYPLVFNNVKKCFRCLKCNLNVVDRCSKRIRSLKGKKRLFLFYCLNCTQNKIRNNFRLKRLRNIAATSLAVTKFTCKNYLFNPINTTFSKMKKSTTLFKLKRKPVCSSAGNGLSNSAYLSARKRGGADLAGSYSTADIYRQAQQLSSAASDSSSGEDADGNSFPNTLTTVQSYPLFNNTVNCQEGSMRRSKSMPKINSRVSLA